jgi:hypothetical protein
MEARQAVAEVPTVLMQRSSRLLSWCVLAAVAAGAVAPVALSPAATVSALDNTPWVLPSAPPRCTTQQVESGNVAGCIVAFYEDPSSTGWGTPPAPGVGEGWTWNGYWYNGSPALATWESTYIRANAAAIGALRVGALRTHAQVQALFEGFLTEITANGYRVRDASGYGFRCTAASGGWTCPSGDPDDLSNHAWGLAIDMNASTNPIRSYAAVDGVTACQTPIETDLPQWVIQTAEKWGLYWGGYGWNSGCPSTSTERQVVERDPPHFEFRGTPRQAAAIAAFNLGSNPNAVCRTVVNNDGNDIRQCGFSARPPAGTRLAVDLDPPAGAVAALINLTATDAEAPGYLTLESCGARATPPTTSALTFGTGDTVAAMAIVPISAEGRFCVYRSAPVHSVVDVAGYVGANGQPLWYEPATPTRLTDTRVDGACEPGAACRPGQLPAGSRQSVPTSTPDARFVNLTVIDARAPGYLQVGRCADVGGQSSFSNLNTTGTAARANLALVPSSDTGTCAFSSSVADVIVDELGTLDATTGLGWKLVPQRRIVDTRLCSPQWCENRPGAGRMIELDLATASPGAAIAVTVTDTSGLGFVTVGRCADLANGGAGRTSNVNYRRGVTVTGLALVALDAGKMCAFTSASAHLVIDVQAELTAEHQLGLLPVSPARAHDSRLAG